MKMRTKRFRKMSWDFLKRGDLFTLILNPPLVKSFRKFSNESEGACRRGMLSKRRFEKKHVFDFTHRLRESLPLINLKYAFSLYSRFIPQKYRSKSAVTEHLYIFFSNIEKETSWIISSKKTL